MSAIVVSPNQHAPEHGLPDSSYWPQAPQSAAPVELAHVQWHGTDDLPQILTRLQAGKVVWQLVKSNNQRHVYRLVTADGTSYYLKHDLACGLRNKLKSCLRNKCRREFLSGQALQRAGIPIVPYLGWGRHGSATFLLSAEVANAVDLATAWQQAKATPQQRAQLSTAVAIFLYQLTTANVWHPDFHAGNILVVPGAPMPTLCLVDVYGVRRRAKATAEQRHNLLNVLAFMTSDQQRTALADFLASCGSETLSGRQRQRLASDVLASRGRAMLKRWHGRKQRLLKNSSLCQQQHTGHGSWILRSFLPVSTAEHVVATHLANVADAKDIVRQTPKRTLSRVGIDANTRYVVKEFAAQDRRPALLRPDRRSWLNHYIVELAGIPACRCHAWLQTSDRRAVLLLEDVGRQNLVEVIADCPRSVCRQRLLAQLGSLVGQLHAVGISHGDLTATNVIVSEAAADIPALILTGLDSLRRHLGVPSRRRRLADLRNLLELLALHCSRRDCLRMLAVYRATLPLCIGQKDTSALLNLVNSYLYR